MPSIIKGNIELLLRMKTSFTNLKTCFLNSQMNKLIPALLLLMLSGCTALESLPYSPPQTPASWLQIQPFMELKIAGEAFILVQPSTSAIVYLLGVLTIIFGVYLLRVRGDHRSRLWWGVALVLWGAGALLAGTSYEAFSYQIKCAGRTACLWTSWWEIVYLAVSAASIDAMLLAAAFSSATGKLRRALISYGSANAVLYCGVLITGALLPVKFLISFELLLLVATPGILVLLGLNGWRYIKRKLPVDLALCGIWLGLGAVIGAYFLYYSLGITPILWAEGVWFSENDVLHIGLILWMIAVVRVVTRHVQDLPEEAA